MHRYFGHKHNGEKSGKSSSKLSKPKRKEDLIVKRCLGKLKERNKILIDSLKINDDLKIAFLMSMQKTMEKLVDEL